MIGEIIKREREIHDMTTKELAALSGVPMQSLYNQEHGKKDLTIDELFKVDKVFDNDIVWELVTYYGGQS